MKNSKIHIIIDTPQADVEGNPLIGHREYIIECGHDDFNVATVGDASEGSLKSLKLTVKNPQIG